VFAIATSFADDVVDRPRDRAHLPVLGASAVSSLRPERYTVGSAVNQTTRQVGGAIGIALLVVLVGTSYSLADALQHFHRLWFFGASMAAAAGLTCVFLARRPASSPSTTNTEVAPSTEVSSA
jgi:hypothetical protein